MSLQTAFSTRFAQAAPVRLRGRAREKEETPALRPCQRQNPANWLGIASRGIFQPFNDSCENNCWLRRVGPLLVPLCHSPGLLALPRRPTRPTMLAPMAIAHSTFDIRLRLWRFAFRDSASEFLAQQRRRPSDRSGDGSQRHTGRLQLSHFAHVNVRDWSAKLLSFAAGSSQTSFYALDD